MTTSMALRHCQAVCVKEGHPITRMMCPALLAGADSFIYLLACSRLLPADSVCTVPYSYQARDMIQRRTMTGVR